MSGLILSLAANEAFLVNGVRLQNGEKPSRIRICDKDARVLRCRDVLKPQDVNTPVKQIYYAVQLLISDDIDEAETVPALRRACADVADAFAACDPEIGPTLRSMIDRGSYYSLLCYVKQLIVIEADLLSYRSRECSPDIVKKVA